MKITIGILLLVVVLALGFGLIWPQIGGVFMSFLAPKSVTADDVPLVLSKLRASSRRDDAFAVFMFSTPDKPGDDGTLNIQFSVENGKPGFDWVLMGPRNIADQSRYIEFAKAKGFAPKAMEMNNVKYIRVEDGDLAALCLAVITELYHVPHDAQLGIVVEGFDLGEVGVPAPH